MTNQPKKRTLNTRLLVACALIVSLVAYVGGYYAVSEEIDLPDFEGVVVRKFDNDRTCAVFWPLGWLEMLICGKVVVHVKLADMSSEAVFDGPVPPIPIKGDDGYLLLSVVNIFEL